MAVNDIAQAAAALKAGELVAFPTETVYGLGADAANPVALAKIFAAKGRPADHPLIVHLPAASHLERWAINIPPAAFALASAFWPGPLTLILQRHPAVPDLVTGGQASVGLRVPNHPLALALLREFGSGIAAPSANRFGRISPTTAQHVRDELGEAVAVVLDGGPCAVGIESTILDLTRPERPRILRPGAIGAAELGRALHVAVTERSPGDEHAPRVSGALAAHYAPRTPLQLVAPEHLSAAVRQALAAGERLAVLAMQTTPDAHSGLVWRIASADFSAYAHDLYANLRALDSAACARILVEAPPATAAWRAVNDRLQRAAVGSNNT
ncbi:MAG: threonylcarbamoyl-AMP synthase [Betaproteobacteria bacterium HGW-Betaproteobacteria-11]|nr:MAG: threonylcarbamoyl-AMP synthase [Betaproteobacteria bacterium HGW-Betaproteobacteria-11]